MKNTIILATFSVLLFTSCSKSSVDDNGTGNTAVPVSLYSLTIAASVILPDTMIAATSHHIVLYAWMHLCHK